MRLAVLFIAALIAGCNDNQPMVQEAIQQAWEAPVQPPATSAPAPIDKPSAKSTPAPRVQKAPDELIVLTRPGVVTYSVDGARGTSGFDADLARLLTQHLGVKLRVVVASNDADIHRRLKNDEAHLAAAWQVPLDDPQIRASAPYFQSRDVLVKHEASLPISSLEQLAHKTVHVVAGSRQEKKLRARQSSIPGLEIVALSNRTELDLLEGVEKRRYETALVDHAVFNIGNNFYPDLEAALEIGDAHPIVWLFAPGVAQELIERANAFLAGIRASGELARLEDRYFGHVTRLTPADSERFLERMRSVLPKYRTYFYSAQIETGIDWRLLAALAYQESQWDPMATSPTGVRGIMMLTEDTADALGVGNRLDAAQSIRAGARYLGDLQDALPSSVNRPDRQWLAMAAYNLGMGHLNAARGIAKRQSANPDSWYEMKRILPLLAQPKYYNRLKSGKGRGGEAVIMVENIRVYADILRRYEKPYLPMGRDIERIAEGRKLETAER
ncbi:MAG: membrane-bound lytic murein transglycosylase MltF [Propionivibrio sp.]